MFVVSSEPFFLFFSFFFFFLVCCFSHSYRFSTGGTFTDVYAELPDGTSTVLKLLSVDPENYSDGPREGIRRVISSFKKTEVSKDQVPDDEIEYVKMGTTVATNALLERNGARFVFLTTKGHRDVLEIGDQVEKTEGGG